MLILLSGLRPQLCRPAQPSQGPTHSHHAQVEAWDTSLLAELNSYRQPRKRNNHLTPPFRVHLVVFLLDAHILRPALGAFLALELSLAEQAHKVAKHAAQPGTIRPQIDLASDLASAGSRSNGPASSVAPGQHAVVSEESHVLKELERHVKRALCQRSRVENLILAWLGTLKQRAHPGIHREETEKAQGSARGGEKRAHRGKARRAGIDRSDDCITLQELVETRLQRSGLGLQIGEDVEGIVDGGEECTQAAWACQKPFYASAHSPRYC